MRRLLIRRGRSGALIPLSMLLCACFGSVTEPRGPAENGHNSDSSHDDDPTERPGTHDAGGAIDGDAGSSASHDLTLDARAALAKVKGLLTGLAPSEQELADYTKTPEVLPDLIRGWQQTPEYRARLVDFFTTTFQQGQVTAQLINNVSPFEQGYLDARVIQMMRESFGRTALALLDEGKPFTEVLTTRRFMLTPALMVAMAWLEERQSGDGGGVRDALNDKLGGSAHYVMQADEVIPLEQSSDPSSPNYLRFYSPQVAAATGDCRNAFTVDGDNRLTLYTLTLGETLMMWMMGQPLQRGFCAYPEGQGILDASDFTTWRMMSIRTPNPGEEQTWVYDVPTFRSGQELVFPKPHVGFYTTPAFLYTWQTNESNQARVTANQTLIVALGRRFDGSLAATPASDAAVDKLHAVPGTDCFNCHITMDPMRQFFRSTFSYFYGIQEDANVRAMPGVWAFEGTTHVATDIADLGASLAQSRRFAIGWVHKLCTWANGAVCDPSGDNLSEPSDPEFLRIVQSFEQGNFAFHDLVRELFSSPLVTHRSTTLTSEQRGLTLAVKKREDLCRTWDARLGLADVCGLSALPGGADADTIKTIATVLPSDSYSRGQTLPTLANDPGLFFYAGVENACQALARRALDGTSTSRFDASAPEQTIQALVHDVMALPPPEDAAAIAILRDHFASAQAEGASDLDAMRSTFVLACLSPSAMGVGL